MIHTGSHIVVILHRWSNVSSGMINALRNVGSGLNLIQQTLTSHKEKVKVVSALLAAVCADFYMISIVYLFMSIYRSVLSLSNLGSLIYREIHVCVAS